MKKKHIFQCKTVWKQKGEIPTVLIFVSDKNILTGEALEMWGSRVEEERREPWEMFSKRGQTESLSEEKALPINGTVQNSLFHLRFDPVRSLSAIYLHVLLSHLLLCMVTLYYIVIAVYSSVF